MSVNKTTEKTVRDATEVNASTVKSKKHAVAPGRDEDQLRRPTDELLEFMGNYLWLEVLAIEESPLDDIGCPDLPAFPVDSHRRRFKTDLNHLEGLV